MRSKKFFKLALLVVLTIGLTLPIFTDPGVAKLNIWVSDVANACGTWPGAGRVTVFDCNGILKWPCGRYLAPNGTWQAVPNGEYRNLYFNCGHLEVEVPPGCYWVVAGNVTPILYPRPFIHLNYTTHVGIVQAHCGKTSCIKLYNPSLRLCWNWFWIGLRMHTIARSKPPLDPKKVQKIEMLIEDLLKDIPSTPVEEETKKFFNELFTESKEKQQKQQK